MEEANGQTKIIERDLAKLSERFDRHLEIYATNGKELSAVKTQLVVLDKSITTLNQVVDNRFQTMSVEQTNQWTKIERNDNETNQLKITMNGLALKVGMIAGLAATAASAIVVFIIEKILN